MTHRFPSGSRPSCFLAEITPRRTFWCGWTSCCWPLAWVDHFAPWWPQQAVVSGWRSTWDLSCKQIKQVANFKLKCEMLCAISIWCLFLQCKLWGFMVACSRNSFDPDCPTQHVALLLLILSFTPCDATYSLTSFVREKMPSSKRFLGGVCYNEFKNGWPKASFFDGFWHHFRCPRSEMGNPPEPKLSHPYDMSLGQLLSDGGDLLWAKNLFRLHCSLLYFFAAEFKIQPEWLGPNGGTLIKDTLIFYGRPPFGVSLQW